MHEMNKEGKQVPLRKWSNCNAARGDNATRIIIVIVQQGNKIMAIITIITGYADKDYCVLGYEQMQYQSYSVGYVTLTLISSGENNYKSR